MKKRCLFLVFCMCISAMIFAASTQVFADTSGDSYITYDSANKIWTLGTTAVEKKLQLNTNGQFLLTSFKNKLTGREYIQGGLISDEFLIRIGTNDFTGASPGWVYDTYAVSTLSQGELQLVITFHNSVVKVNRYYVVYPSTGVIQEWSVFQNVSGGSRNFSNPSIFRNRIMSSDMANVDFFYMTGGGNFTGSHILKPVSATRGAGYTRTFDSHDTPEVITVDGVNAVVNGNINGTAIYNEFYALRNTSGAGEGVFLTFDYLGHWAADMGNVDGTGNFRMNGRVALTDLSVANGAAITSPKSMTGVFTGDIDDMGNTILDYSYRYKWDYTRPQHFGKVRVVQWLGMWANPNESQIPNAFAAINNARYIGAEGLWIDDDWFDIRGNWNTIYGDDFKALNQYATKNGMDFSVWYPTWHVGNGQINPPLEDNPVSILGTNPEYEVAGDFREYYGRHLNNADSNAVAWQKSVLNTKQIEWGPHVWRYDGNPMWPKNYNNGNYTAADEVDLLAASNNWYALLKQFKDENQAAGIFGCASGGEAFTIEAARYSDVQQETDGYVNHYDGYWSSLLIPPDKIFGGNNTPGIVCGDISGTFGKDVRYNLCGNWGQGNGAAATQPMTDKEGWRKHIEMFRFLQSRGVNGRWSKVYRPTLMTSGDQTYILQKMDKDNLKGIISIAPKSPMVGSSVIIKPKGLIGSQQYTVSAFEGGMATTTQSGDYWMTNGILLSSLKDGEFLTLSLEDRPGGTSPDNTAPTAPSNVTKKQSFYLIKSGVELNWTASTDNNWLSYYEILRNGTIIDKVSTGTFYFDTYGTTADTYTVRAVDGKNNISPVTAATSVFTDTYNLKTDFSNVMGRNNWYYYQYNGTYNPLAFDTAGAAWTISGTYNSIWSPTLMHPDANETAVAWKAPKAGNVRVSGNVLKSTAGGDGVQVKIMKNGSQIWPSVGAQYINGNDTVGINHDFTVTVAQNDMLYFHVNNGGKGNKDFDAIVWNPTIEYNGTVSPSQPIPPVYSMAGDFSPMQGAKNWYYERWDGSSYQALNWDNVNYKWRKDAATWNNIYSPNMMHPDVNDTVRHWVAPKPGTVIISGNVGKYNTSGGDGVVVRILKNGSQLWSQSIAYNNKTGVNHYISVNVSQGDSIYFIVNQGGNNGCDTTRWDSTIQYTVVGGASISGSWSFDEDTGTQASDSSCTD